MDTECLQAVRRKQAKRVCNNNNKRASLAFAARLADPLCLPEAPFGRLGPHWSIIRKITSLNTSVLLL